MDLMTSNLKSVLPCTGQAENLHSVVDVILLTIKQTPSVASHTQSPIWCTKQRSSAGDLFATSAHPIALTSLRIQRQRVIRCTRAASLTTLRTPPVQRILPRDVHAHGAIQRAPITVKGLILQSLKTKENWFGRERRARCKVQRTGDKQVACSRADGDPVSDVLVCACSSTPRSEETKLDD